MDPYRTASPLDQPDDIPAPDAGTEAIQRHYWAMQPRERLGEYVRQAFERYQRELSARGWTDRIAASRLRYHGFDPDGGAATSADVMEGGEQGEIDLVQENHYRSLIRAMLAMATSSRPAYRAAATDDSAESMAACTLAEQVWEYELEHGLETIAREGAERMLVECETGVLAVWDPEAGEIVGGEPIYETDEDGRPVMDTIEEPAPRLDPITGQPVVDPLTGQPAIDITMRQVPRQIGERPIYSGEVAYEALGPCDVARDMQVRRLRDVRWVVVRRVMSRWDLCATYGDDDESTREILAASGPSARASGEKGDGRYSTVRDGDDQCYVLELYHAPTPAVPGGRYARVVGSHVLEEHELRYDRIPVILKAPSEVLDRAVGYTDAWDLLGLAKLLDSVVSDIASEASRYGQRPVLLPEGSDISPADVMGPAVIDAKIDTTTGRMLEPKWMDVPEISAGALKWAEFLQNQMQVLSGINSVVRGDPEASLKSGAALALVQAMAVQHNSAFQASWAELLRDLATLVIELYKANASTERLIDIVGDDERGTVVSFTGEQLKPVRRIRAELGNPLMRTIAGKKELADFMADPNRFPTDPPLTRTQYLGFITSGRLDPLFRAGRSAAIGIKSECEALARGEHVPVLITDNHEKHIPEHTAILDGKQRMQLSPQAIRVLTEHIMEHIAKWVELTNTNPALLAATGQRPAPMLPPPVGAPPGPPGPGGGPPGGAPEKPGDIPMGPPPAGPMAASPIPGASPTKMPSPPINPATGQPAALPNGAIQ